MQIRCEAEVARILVRDGRVTGVRWPRDAIGPGRGQQRRRPRDVRRLLDPSALAPEFLDAVDRISYDSASLKINVPSPSCRISWPAPVRGWAPASRPIQSPRSRLHRARVRRRQVRPASARRSSSANDPLGGRRTVAPPGRHSCRVIHTAVRATGETGRCARPSRTVLRAARRVRETSAPVLARQSSPARSRAYLIDRRQHLQGAMTRTSSSAFRPVPGHAGIDSRSGSLSVRRRHHPGGGVMGDAGTKRRPLNPPRALAQSPARDEDRPLPGGHPLLARAGGAPYT